MKTKAIILIAVTALVTLSFTFASFKKSSEKESHPSNEASNEPIGGFVAVDKKI
jgi:hypothetical protein